MRRGSKKARGRHGERATSLPRPRRPPLTGCRYGLRPAGHTGYAHRRRPQRAEAAHAHPAALDAGFVRAHAGGGDADAERRARLARRQRRSASSTSPSPTSILAQARVSRAPSSGWCATSQPDVVGLSVMTFQRRTALRVVALIRALRPSAAIVVGGYDPSLAPEAWTNRRRTSTSSSAAKASMTFRELLRALEAARRRRRRARIAGLSLARRRRASCTTPIGQSPTCDRALRLPNRAARVLGRLHAARAGRSTSSRPRAAARSTAASARSSRCAAATSTASRSSACSPTSPTRARRGARAIFLVDDNITLDVRALRGAVPGDHRGRPATTSTTSCRRMTAPIADHGATLAPLMRRAGFRYVFLGIENVLDEDLAFLQARAPRTRARDRGRAVGNATHRRHRPPAPPRDARRRRPDRRQSRTTRASRSRPTWPSRGATSTGRTSSIRRRIRARR